MSNPNRRASHKSVRVAPTVTDPTMRAARQAAADSDDESGYDKGSHTVDMGDRDAIFGASQKTKEEQDSDLGSSQNGMLLVVVFGLIVIALVALIVWMLMKQSNDKKDEEEMRRLVQPGLQPHPRNNMPNKYNRGVQQGPYAGHSAQPVRPSHPASPTSAAQSAQYVHSTHPAQLTPSAHSDNTDNTDQVLIQPSQSDFEAHNRDMQFIQQQQAEMQKQLNSLNQKTHHKTFAEVMAENTQKEIRNDFAKPQKQVRFTESAKTPANRKNADNQDTMAASPYTASNPHPSILRPENNKPTRSEVDLVLEQTQALMQSRKPSKKEDLTDSDKALLDKINNNKDEDDPSEDDS